MALDNNDKVYDIAIVGAGPAGLSAGIYGARALFDTVIYERGITGGQIAQAMKVENYPGAGVMGGAELANKMRAEAEGFGVDFQEHAVSSLDYDEEHKIWNITTDSSIDHSKVVIVGTGTRPRTTDSEPKLAGFAGEEEFKGHGVSYCATCDAMFFRGKHIFVVGTNNHAAQDAIYLAKFGSHVTLVSHKDKLKATAPTRNAVENTENIDVLLNSRIDNISGQFTINSVVVENIISGEKKEYTAEENSFFGIFISLGNNPISTLVADYVELSEVDNGVITNADMSTRMPGLYCIGDMRTGVLRQVVTAAADGAIAATAAKDYIEGL